MMRWQLRAVGTCRISTMRTHAASHVAVAPFLIVEGRSATQGRFLKLAHYLLFVDTVSIDELFM
jgi:hypothetical protein